MTIEAVDTRARGLRPHRTEAVEVASAIRRIDWLLLGGMVALLAYGLWAISGITARDVTGNANYFVVRQAVYAAVGCLGFVALLFVDPQIYRRYKRPIYVGTAGLMLLVLLGGTVSRHSKRWLDIGFFRFQPSEFRSEEHTSELQSLAVRSEERRVGKECSLLCRSRWSPYH